MRGSLARLAEQDCHFPGCWHEFKEFWGEEKPGQARPRDHGWNGTRREEREIEEEAVKHLMCDSGPKQEELQLQKHSLAL